MLRFLLVTILFSAVSLRASDFTGKVVEVRPDDRQLVVAAESHAPRTFLVGRGDALIWEVGDLISGHVVAQGDDERLERIFPADPAEVAVLEKLGEDLKRDTLRLGMKAFRAVGERVPRFALWDDDGELFLSESLRGKYVVMNFVFTRCTQPNMCPAATARMIQLDTALDEKGWDDVALVSVTLDPAYDTPGIWTAYAMDRAIDLERHHLLGGPADVVEALKKQMGVLAEPDEQEIVRHTMSTALIDPTGKIIYRLPGSRWTPSVFVEEIAEAKAKAP
jgi:protein SCO1/2